MTAYIETKLNPKTNEYDWRDMDFELHTVAEFDALTGKYGFKLQDHPHSAIVAPRILESLSVESIAFVTGTTWRYTFVTVDLSSVSVGDFLHIKTTTSAANSGRFAITAKGADYVDVVNADGVAQAGIAGTAAISGQPLAEVDSNTPLAIQYSPDYRKGTARVFMHVDNVGTRYVVYYQGGGTVLGLDQWETLVEQILDGMSISGGSGSGIPNFVLNPDAETDALNWGISSGADITITRVTDSTVLDGDASLLIAGGASVAIGDYAYAEMSAIPRAFRSRQLQIQFEYDTGADYEEGDVEVVIFDGTNEITPSVNVIPVGNGTFRAVFPSSASTSAYQVWFRSTVATDSWDFIIDDLTVNGMDLFVTGSASGYVTSYAPTVNTGAYGTLERNVARVWRRGKFALILWEFNQTGSGTAGSGDYRFSMPPGLQIDTAYTAENVSTVGNIGRGYVDATGPSTSVIVARAYDADTFFATVVEVAATNIGSGSYSLANSALRISLEMLVPIVGWDETTVLQNSRVEYAHNSDTTNANDAISFAYGANGSPVPTVSASTKTKRVRFSTPRQAGDLLQLQVNENGLGWIDSGSTRFKFEFYNDNSNNNLWYGMHLEPINDTDVDVHFNLNGVFTSTTINSWATENSNGTRWRVVKCSNPLAVESPRAVESITFRHEETSGTGGGTPTAGAWTKATINAIENPMGYPWASLSSDVITLSPGIYRVTAVKEVYAVGNAKIRFRDTLNSVTTISGHSTYNSGSTTDAGGSIYLTGTFALPEQATYELQYHVAATNTDRLGLPVSTGDVEVYTTVTVDKLA